MENLGNSILSGSHLSLSIFIYMYLVSFPESDGFACRWLEFTALTVSVNSNYDKQHISGNYSTYVARGYPINLGDETIKTYFLQFLVPQSQG